jgi:group I intron endonuclease
MGKGKGKHFENGRIYCIRNIMNDMIYIGSTTQSLSKRFSVHKSMHKNQKYKNIKLYNAMIEYGIENFYIELIYEIKCNNIEILKKEEQINIRLYNSINNGYNQRISYIDNERKKEIKQYLKQYHIEHENKDYNNDYAIKNHNKYTCDICNYKTHILTHYNYHINTNLHNKKNNVIENGINKGELTITNFI